jgi:hypothetical protein
MLYIAIKISIAKKSQEHFNEYNKMHAFTWVVKHGPARQSGAFITVQKRFAQLIFPLLFCQKLPLLPS